MCHYSNSTNKTKGTERPQEEKEGGREGGRERIGALGLDRAREGREGGREGGVSGKRIISCPSFFSSSSSSSSCFHVSPSPLFIYKISIQINTYMTCAHQREGGREGGKGAFDHFLGLLVRREGG